MKPVIQAGQEYVLTPTGEGLNNLWREYKIGETGCKMQFAFDNPSQQAAISLRVVKAEPNGFTGLVESRFAGSETSVGAIGWIESDHWALKNYLAE